MSVDVKRKRCELEASTPVGDRREVILVPLEDSPIEGVHSEQEESESSINVSTGSQRALKFQMLPQVGGE